MPSLGGEVFGLVAAENRWGRCVIASDIGALAEVLGDAGMKFPTGDAEGLARCMEKYYCRASARRKDGTNGGSAHRAVLRGGSDGRGTHASLREGLESSSAPATMPRLDRESHRRTQRLKDAVRRMVPRSTRNGCARPRNPRSGCGIRLVFFREHESLLNFAYGLFLVCHPRAYKVFGRDQVDDPEQSAEFLSFLAYCSDAMFLYDIGAHFGIFSLAAAQLGARAIAVDPSPSAAQMIQTELNC